MTAPCGYGDNDGTANISAAALPGDALLHRSCLFRSVEELSQWGTEPGTEATGSRYLLLTVDLRAEPPARLDSSSSSTSYWSTASASASSLHPRSHDGCHRDVERGAAPDAEVQDKRSCSAGAPADPTKRRRTNRRLGRRRRPLTRYEEEQGCGSRHPCVLP